MQYNVEMYKLSHELLLVWIRMKSLWKDCYLYFIDIFTASLMMIMNKYNTITFTKTKELMDLEFRLNYST